MYFVSRQPIVIIRIASKPMVTIVTLDIIYVYYHEHYLWTHTQSFIYIYIEKKKYDVTTHHYCLSDRQTIVGILYTIALSQTPTSSGSSPPPAIRNLKT